MKLSFKRNRPFCKNIAIKQGYTQELTMNSEHYVGSILIKPTTDLDSTFRAYCLNRQSFMYINGWRL